MAIWCGRDRPGQGLPFPRGVGLRVPSRLTARSQAPWMEGCHGRQPAGRVPPIRIQCARARGVPPNVHPPAHRKPLRMGPPRRAGTATHPRGPGNRGAIGTFHIPPRPHSGPEGRACPFDFADSHAARGRRHRRASGRRVTVPAVAERRRGRLARCRTQLHALSARVVGQP